MNKKLFTITTAILLFSLLSMTVFADSSSTGIFSGLGDIARFLKRLIVPDANYFHNELASLSKHANDRLGGVAYLYLMINNFFNQLKNVPNMALNFSIPNNFYFRGFQGVNIDVLGAAKPFIDLIRNVLTSAACLFTAVTCYHKLRTFFQQGDNS